MSRTAKILSGPANRVVAATIAAILIFVFVSWHNYERARDVQLSDMQNNADRALVALDAHITHVVDDADAYLRVLRDFYIDHAAGPALRRYIDDTRSGDSLGGMGDVLIIDESGHLAFLRSQPDAPRTDMADLPYFTSFSADPRDRLFIEPTRLGRATHAYLFRICRPILIDGAFKGVIVLTLRPETITSLFGQLDLGPHSTVSVLQTEARQFIARAPLGQGDYFGRTLGTGPLWGALAQSSRGRFHAQGLIDGANRYFTYAKVSDAPIVSVIGVADMDVDASLADTRRDIAVQIIAFALAACAICGLILRLFRVEANFRRANASLEHAQQMGRIGCAEVDLLTSEVSWSRELYPIYGRDPALGPANLEDFLCYIHPEDRGLSGVIRAQHDTGVLEGAGDFRILRTDGEVRWIHRELDIERDRDGTPVRLFSTEQDVTDRKRIEAELRKSEAGYRRLIGSIGEYAIFTLDAQGRVADWNSVAERIKGYAADEIIGQHFSIFYAEADRARGEPERALRLALSEGKYEVVAERLRKGGERFWVNVVITPIYDDKMEHVGFAKVTRDITERVNIEEELRRKDEHLVRAQRVGVIGSVEVDLSTGRQIWSDGLYLLFGLDPQTIEPSFDGAANLVHPEDRAMLREQYQKALAGDPCDAVEIRITRPDGEMRWVRRQSEFERDSAGNPIRFIATYQDITERRTMEFDVRRANEILIFAQRMAHFGSAEISLRRDRVVRTDEFYRILGITARDAMTVSQHVIDAFHPDDREKLRRAVDEMIAGRPVPSMELRVVRLEGEMIWVRRDQDFIFGPDGKPEIAVVTLLDITDQKRLEIQKDEFVSTVSHELRTPLTSIRGALALLAGGVLEKAPDKARHMIEVALRNSERLARLVDDLLDVQRIQAGRMVYYMDNIDIVRLASDAIEAMRAFAGRTNINIRLVAEMDTAFVRADPERMMQVMANLLSNAVKFSPAGQAVEVRIVRRSPWIRVTVEDHGEGIPAEFQTRIFQRFAQSDSSDRRKQGGSGLGLNIAAAIIAHHQGEISFETELGQGTRFHIDLTEVPAAMNPSAGTARMAGE